MRDAGLVSLPAGAEGGTAAARRQAVSVAGIVLALEADDPGIALRAGPGGAFAAGEAAPDLLLSGRREDLSGRARGETLFETRGSWSLGLDGERLSFSVFAPHLGPAPFVSARIDRAWSRGELAVNEAYFPEGTAVEPLSFPLDEVLYMHLLARGRGLLVHACGLVVDGRGLLFVGHSGDGKSTTARLFEARGGVRILSDDRIVLRRDRDGFRMFGTPWHGEGLHADPGSAPLAGVFILEKAAATNLREMRAAEAAAALLARAFVPFHAAASLEETLELLDELVACVPCRVLRFRPDETATDLVKRWLGEQS